MTTPINLAPRTLRQVASNLEKDAADMEAHAATLKAEQRPDGGFHTSNHLQTALHAAAEQARRTAAEYRKAALYAQALTTMQAAPICPQEWAIFDSTALKQAEELYVWRSTAIIPAEGQRVQVRLNGLGPGQVAGYFLSGEAGSADPEQPHRRFLGVAVMLESPPDWYKKQCPQWQSEPARVFGSEIAAD